MEQANPKFEKVAFVCATTLGALFYGLPLAGAVEKKTVDWRISVWLLLCVIVFVAVSKIAWRIGDWFRRFTMPSMYFAAGSWDMFWKRLGYMVGPQFAALFITWWIVLVGLAAALGAIGVLKQ